MTPNEFLIYCEGIGILIACLGIVILGIGLIIKL
jgi:hypothetical protein